MPAAARFFALTTCGLEDVSGREIAGLAGVTVGEVGYRRVSGLCRTPLDALLSLRTVDDIFLDVATWQEIERPRSALGRLSTLSRQLDLEPARAACAQLRPIATPPSFSVTASFVGQRNYRTSEIKEAIADGVAAACGWRHQADDRVADLNVRIFIEQTTAYVGVRLAQTALHDRAYQRSHRPGALKPPVAAALLELAEVKPGHRLLDPCCGTGTILIEAALRGALAQGGDLEPEAIYAAGTNAAAAGVALELREMDVRALPHAAASVDRIVSNLPWGRQVAAAADLTALYDRALAELARVLVPGGRMALLVETPALPQLLHLRGLEQREISLFGQTPAIFLYERV
jgi:23S rRNA G2445 N2-methylase RlmL